MSAKTTACVCVVVSVLDGVRGGGGLVCGVRVCEGELAGACRAIVSCRAAPAATTSPCTRRPSRDLKRDRDKKHTSHSRASETPLLTDRKKERLKPKSTGSSAVCGFVGR